MLPLHADYMLFDALCLRWHVQLCVRKPVASTREGGKEGGRERTCRTCERGGVCVCVCLCVQRCRCCVHASTNKQLLWDTKQVTSLTMHARSKPPGQG